MKFANLAIIGTLVVVPGYVAQATESNMDRAGTTMVSMQEHTGSVARATFTTAVQDREPVDSISTLTNDGSKVYYFTEIHDMSGQTVTHRWQYNGEVMAEVQFDIGGPRWRIYSSKTLMPYWLGNWEVSVVDESGNPLSVNTFSYTADTMTQ